jgi:acyl-coenzyme A thioesterase PaaI-like protein
MTERSLQEIYAPHARCFGCGPANERGLRLRSLPAADGHVVVDFMSSPHHDAFENVVNGGIIGTIFDCHMNWTAIYNFITTRGLDHAPACVTATFEVVFRRPTPSGLLHVDAHVISVDGDRATVEARLTAGGKVTATSSGTFVVVKPDHPAYHRW